MKITTIAFIFIWITSSSCFGQEWKALQSNENISINTAEINYESPKDGIQHQRVIFQYKNLTNNALTVTFNRTVSYGDQQIRQDKTYSITIPANSNVEYNEENSKNKAFYIFSKDLKGTIQKVLHDFHLNTIKMQ